MLADHGMIAAGESLNKAMWRALELETLARQCRRAWQPGDPVIQSDGEINETFSRRNAHGQATWAGFRLFSCVFRFSFAKSRKYFKVTEKFGSILKQS